MIFTLLYIFEVVQGQNCRILNTEQCISNQLCVIDNDQCIEKWKQCYNVQSANTDNCSKVDCKYDVILDICTYIQQKSEISVKLEEYLKQKNQQKRKKHQRITTKVNFSILDIYLIKQEVQQQNQTFHQLNYIINFSTIMITIYLQYFTVI